LWNQTGNLFTANINYTIGDETKFILVNLRLPEIARGAYAESNNVIFHVSEGIETPYILLFLSIGAVFVLVGIGIFATTRVKETPQQQPIKEKWQTRRRKRRKRKK
jgi:hypothetical protein